MRVAVTVAGSMPVTFVQLARLSQCVSAGRSGSMPVTFAQSVRLSQYVRGGRSDSAPVTLEQLVRLSLYVRGGRSDKSPEYFELVPLSVTLIVDAEKSSQNRYTVPALAKVFAGRSAVLVVPSGKIQNGLEALVMPKSHNPASIWIGKTADSASNLNTRSVSFEPLVIVVGSGNPPAPLIAVTAEASVPVVGVSVPPLAIWAGRINVSASAMVSVSQLSDSAPDVELPS